MDLFDVKGQLLLRGVIVSNIKFLSGFPATVIDNDFIDNYMAKAPSPVFSLIYIYGCRCASAGISVSNSDIAKKFNVIESDVIKAWKYWKKEGLILAGGTKEEPYIEFVTLRADEEQAAAVEEKPEEKAKIVVASPAFKPSDINDIIEKNPEVGELLKVAEGQKGKPVTPKEAETIVWMYQSLELPFEVICTLLSFCYKNNKPAKYMEKTALDWVEKGITTLEAASSYLSFFNNYGKVLRFFGVTDRTPNQKEQNYIDKWIKEWQLGFELIELAAKRTVENTGKAAFSYCNKILESWYKSGLNTIEAIEKSEADYKGKKGTAKQHTLPQQPKGVFNNYNQKIYSPDEIAEILKRKGNGQ